MIIKYSILLIILSLNAQAAPISTLGNLTKFFHNVRDFTIHKNEAYFSAQSTLGDLSVIIRIEKQDNQWSNPKIASFSGEHQDIEPFISGDGLKLYYASKRPTNTKSMKKDYDIWYVTRKSLSEKWSNPINMGNIINTTKNEFYPSLSNNGNLYFTANYEDSKGKDDIYLSKFKQGEFHKPYSLPESINSSGDEYNAYIAKDESYLIFGSYKRNDGFGSGDLYISYNLDGQWTTAQNMGEQINSKQMDYCPFIDGKTMYFTSKRSTLTPSKFNSINALLSALNSAQNGLSRIYQVDFEVKP